MTCAPCRANPQPIGYNAAVSLDALQRVLAELPRMGQPVKVRPYREVWRFEYAGKGYYLKFYPRRGGRLKRMFFGSPAMREFTRLQWLQKAGVPAPRAVAVMMGFRIENRTGDAVILQAIEPATPLAEVVDQALLQGEQVQNHYGLLRQILGILQRLRDAGLGHRDLHLGNFLLKDGQVYLLDAYAVHRWGLGRRDLMRLAHSADRIATRADLQRAWEIFGDGRRRMPEMNTIRQKLVRKFVSKTTQENAYFGRMDDGTWSGSYYRSYPSAKRWSVVSRLKVGAKDWEAAWPVLRQQIEQDELPVIKRTASGDVLCGEVTLGGQTVPVIIKRPRRKYWHRWLTDIGRGGRAWRAWSKAWGLVVRDIPTAWPIAMMERRRFGYAVDQLIVFEKIDGPVLAEMNLEALSADAREILFRRSGHLLRKMERDGLFHWDAKAYNFMVRTDEKLGPQPMLIDVDGIRTFQYTRFAMHRLLRSMRDNPHYTPEDSKALCLGYAPTARLVKEDANLPNGETV